MSNETHESALIARGAWEQEHLAEPVRYPGHPVVLACMVMDRYESFEDAFAAVAQGGVPAALKDPFIPGSGCAVYAALDLLAEARGGRFEYALNHAQAYWHTFESSDASKEASAAGRAQASKMLPYFESRVKAWADPRGFCAASRNASPNSTL